MSDNVRMRDEQSDDELLAEFRRTGDGEHFGELFRRHRPRLYQRCLWFFNGDRALAEETAQDTFVRALEKAPHVAVENIQAWLYEVAKNLAIDKLRQLKVSATGRAPEVPPTGLRVGGTTLEAQEKTAYLQELRDLINGLGEKQRVCLKLAYVDGCRYEEIGRLTGYSEKEVKSALQAGRENLKKKLQSGRQG